MDDIAPVSLFVAILTVLVSLSTVRKKARPELLNEFNKKLRSERLAAYRPLRKVLDTVVLCASVKIISRAEKAGEEDAYGLRDQGAPITLTE